MTNDPSTGTATAVPRGLWADVAVILGAALLMTAASILFDLDRRIAGAILEPGSPLGNRAESAAVASFVVMAVGLAFLAGPPLRRRWPMAARCAGVFAATLLIAVLALIMGIKNEINRPRPDQTVEFGGAGRKRLAVAGRHWATDIIWSAAIVLLVASLLSHLTLSWREP